MADFEEAFGDESEAVPQTFDETPQETQEEEAPADPYASFGEPATTNSGSFNMGYEVDNRALREWEQKHEAELSEQTKKSAAKKIEQQEAGRNAVEKFYSERRALIEKRKSDHRSEQDQFVATRDGPVQGNAWERVASMIDVKAAREGKDVARLRGLLLLLKQNPVEVRSPSA